MRGAVFLPKRGAPLAPPSSGGKQSSLRNPQTSLRNPRGPERASGWPPTTHPRVPGSPRPFSRRVPAPPLETRSFSFNSASARVCGAGRLLPLLLHLALPPPLRVSGEWVTQGGGCHTTPPAPARTADSAGSGPERRGARAGYSRWGRPGGAADLPQPGLALVRMPGGWAAGWGGGVWGRAESPTGSRGGSWRCARRQVRPPGERAPALPPSSVDLVGPAGLL